MIGALSLLRHKPEHTIEQFRHHWRHVHGPLAAELHGVRRYVQSHFLHDDPLTNTFGRSLATDGLAVISFDTEEDREICYASHQEEVCDVDSLLFIGASARYVSDVRSVIPAPAQPTKSRAIMLFTTVPPGLDALFHDIAGSSAVTELAVHAVTSPGATPTQARRQIILPLHMIVEIAADNRLELETAVARLVKAVATGDVATFAAVEHRIV